MYPDGQEQETCPLVKQHEPPLRHGFGEQLEIPFEIKQFTLYILLIQEYFDNY